VVKGSPAFVPGDSAINTRIHIQNANWVRGGNLTTSPVDGRGAPQDEKKRILKRADGMAPYDGEPKKEKKYALTRRDHPREGSKDRG